MEVKGECRVTRLLLRGRPLAAAAAALIAISRVLTRRNRTRDVIILKLLENH